MELRNLSNDPQINIFYKHNEPSNTSKTLIVILRDTKLIGLQGILNSVKVLATLKPLPLW